MGFMKVDTRKAERKGSIFLAKVGTKVVVGRSGSTRKVAAVLTIAAGHINKGHLPEITLLKFKQCSDTFAAESLLHSFLSPYRCAGEYYNATKEELEKIWRNIK